MSCGWYSKKEEKEKKKKRAQVVVWARQKRWPERLKHWAYRVTFSTPWRYDNHARNNDIAHFAPSSQPNGPASSCSQGEQLVCLFCTFCIVQGPRLLFYFTWFFVLFCLRTKKGGGGFFFFISHPIFIVDCKKKKKANRKSRFALVYICLN